MIERQFITQRLPVLGRAVMLSNRKVNEGNVQCSQGKIDAPCVSILLMTDAKSLSTVHWEMALVTYLRDTSRHSEKV